MHGRAAGPSLARLVHRTMGRVLCELAYASMEVLMRIQWVSIVAGFVGWSFNAKAAPPPDTTPPPVPAPVEEAVPPPPSTAPAPAESEVPPPSMYAAPNPPPAAYPPPKQQKRRHNLVFSPWDFSISTGAGVTDFFGGNFTASSDVGA